jgi:hypothetical protein
MQNVDELLEKIKLYENELDENLGYKRKSKNHFGWKHGMEAFFLKLDKMTVRVRAQSTH